MKTLDEHDLSHDMIAALDECLKTDRSLQLEVHGQHFVVLTAETFRGWQETAALLSSSRNAAVLQAALDEPLDECRDLDEVLHDLDGETDASC